MILSLARAAPALALLCALSAAAREEGTTITAVAVPSDPQGAATAVNVARIAKETLRDNKAEWAMLDLEKVLEGGEDPAWLKKLQDAEAARKKGEAAKEGVELNVAADAYAEAVVAYEQAIPGMTNLTPLVDTYVDLASVLVLSGDKAGGKKNFERVLSLDPAFRLPPDANKRVKDAFEAVMREQRKAGNGTLTVYASTGPAEVYVDGIFRGISPVSLEEGSGRHYVRVVKDGWLAFGAGVDVKRGSEVTVNANLRPTAKLSKLEELSARIPRNRESNRPVVELAQALQLDRLVSIAVEQEGQSATLTVVIVDGVSGQQRARGQKAFNTKDPFFDRDVKGYLQERLRAKDGDVGDNDPNARNTPQVFHEENRGKKNDDDRSLLPGKAEAVETPVTVTAGWTCLGIGAVTAASAIGFGIASVVFMNQYKSPQGPPTQLDPKLDDFRNTWLALSIVSDVSTAVTLALAGTATALLVVGFSEQSAKEEIVAP